MYDVYSNLATLTRYISRENTVFQNLYPECTSVRNINQLEWKFPTI